MKEADINKTAIISRLKAYRERNGARAYRIVAHYVGSKRISDDVLRAIVSNAYAGIRKITIPFPATSGRTDLLMKMTVRPLFFTGGLILLKSCVYCGKAHPIGVECSEKPRYDRPRVSQADKFRRSYAWKTKQAAILQRDFHLCRICNDGKYGRYDGRL